VGAAVVARRPAGRGSHGGGGGGPVAGAAAAAIVETGGRCVTAETRGNRWYAGLFIHVGRRESCQLPLSTLLFTAYRA